jgi:hypothetical protein
MVSMIDAFAWASVGETNHSRHFCLQFGRTMVSHLQLCVALQHWARVPALNLPSDYSRILDGYTCIGEPCQILIHLVTLPSGDLEWLLLDVVPNAAQATVVQRDTGNRLVIIESQLI